MTKHPLTYEATHECRVFLLFTTCSRCLIGSNLIQISQALCLGVCHGGGSPNGQKYTAEGRQESGDSFKKEHLAHFIITL